MDILFLFEFLDNSETVSAVIGLIALAVLSIFERARALARQHPLFTLFVIGVFGIVTWLATSVVMFM